MQQSRTLYVGLDVHKERNAGRRAHASTTTTIRNVGRARLRGMPKCLDEGRSSRLPAASCGSALPTARTPNNGDSRPTKKTVR